MFIKNSEDNFLLIGSEEGNKVNRLEKGVYNLNIVDGGPMSPPQIFFDKNYDYQKGVKLDQGIFKETREFFNDFFSESMYEARNILNMKHKLGVMFNGEPGTGKSFTAGQIAQEIADKYDAVGILVTQVQDYSSLIDMVRRDDPDRKIVLIIDEFEKTFKSWDTDTLSFLSGVNERDNLIIIATVNDTDRLPGFIKDRPSRFEKIFEFSFKDEEVLNSIITNLVPEEYKYRLEMDTIISTIKKYNNVSIDRIKHIIRDVISATIERDRTGIIKEVVIKDDSSLQRSVIRGFSSKQDDEVTTITPEMSLEALIDHVCSN